LANGLLPPLKPLAIKERVSVVFVKKGEIDVLDGAFVVIDVTGIRTHIPVGGVACIQPNSRSQQTESIRLTPTGLHESRGAS
jgi:CRISP-associated protein Cas1